MWRGRPCPRRRRRRCTARLSSPSPVPRWCIRPTPSECWLRRAQDDDRVVDLLEGTESLCRNAEDSGQHPRWKPADGLTYADVVFVLRRTGVLDDRYVHVCRATVLEVVKGTLGREHDLADTLIEALVVTVPVDDDPGRDSAGDDVQLPRAGMPVRLADTSRLQREQQDASLLAFENREVVLVSLLKRTPVKCGGG